MKKATPVQINWKPDKNNPVPLYQQIVDYIYQKISSGDWPVGTRLPSQRALAEQFNVNRSTITSALDELTAFGIIRSGHGAGTLVINLGTDASGISEMGKICYFWQFYGEQPNHPNNQPDGI